jgi:exonuclease VII small subunit
MKTKNILGDIKSKSLKEAKNEINDILSKLEKNDIDLDKSMDQYKRLVELNHHIDNLFKLKFKDISVMTKKIKNRKIKKNRNAKK